MRVIDNKSNTLLVIMAHLDDFELSCMGYVYENKDLYNEISLVVLSGNEYKNSITIDNIAKLNRDYDTKIYYQNLEYNATKLFTDLDEIKESIYEGIVDWNEKFDILTHDSDDLHTDHQAANKIAMGLYKYSKRFTTVYSPSSVNFSPNYFIPLTKEFFEAKKEMISSYDIKKDQSFSKKGYYFENHWNLGYSYAMENLIEYESDYYDVYKVLKWR